MVGDDKYTYPGSGGVLRNRLDIRTAELLDQALDDYASLAWVALSQKQPEVLDFDYLSSIHRRLFGEVLSWAGEVRSVDVIAAGADIGYCRPADIAAELEELFRRLAEEDYLSGCDRWDFASRLSERWTRLTAIHPFRDGNTRSQVVYVSRLAERAGHPIDWAAMKVEHLRQLRVSALRGFPQNLADYLYDRLLDPSELNDEDDAAI